jgi:lipopolysaccharide transport system ATP-binding protein
MTRTIIKTDSLGKEYRRGLARSGGLLRDSLAKALRSPASIFGRQREAKFWALRDVSIEVEEGEVLGLIGRNGSGKTTLLKILSRITRPTTGWAEIQGRVGSLLEVGTGFHPELTGRENTYLNGAILGMGRREVTRKFDEIVSFAELEEFIDTPVKHYSSGMYVRLAFAVAAHLEPEILLVDEVLAVGDIKFQRKCLGKMGDVARAGRTIILVSHQLNQIRRLCQRVVWLDAGSLRQSGRTSEVVGAYENAMSSTDQTLDQTDLARSAKARFMSWEIVGNPESAAHRIESVGPLTISFRLRVRPPLRHLHLGIALFDPDRQLVWANAADDLSFDTGLYDLSFSFPFLPLSPRTYHWQLSLWDGEGNVDMWEAFPDMIVDCPNYQHPKDEWNGYINLPSTLQISPVKG